jgi:hypothetical protein
MACLRLAASHFVASQAAAGAVDESLDLAFITPFADLESAHVGSATMDSLGVVELKGFQMPAALTWGGLAGVRLGPFALGVLAQRTEGRTAIEQVPVNLSKVYGEFGIHIPYGAIVGIVHFDFGYTWLDKLGTITEGIGGKAGVALDAYPEDWLSLGAGAALDLQGYRTRRELVGGWGATVCGRIGLHL